MTGCFVAAAAELTEHTKGSLQYSDASVSLQELPIPLGCYKRVYAHQNFSTVSPSISILIKVELKAKCLQ